jgi:hypothetical protein
MLAADAPRLESLHVCTRPRSAAAASAADLPAAASGLPLRTTWVAHLAPGASLTRICFQVYPEAFLHGAVLWCWPAQSVFRPKCWTDDAITLCRTCKSPTEWTT